ncbi:hypothetical protein [Enterococcus rivorum]|uniref:hypothetical protein n=1 Tax=Enterococcus rivorum TaxID=762845 RepID=UPI001B80E5A9|nr:hypothetical protein [Enterococcus rivorum]
MKKRINRLRYFKDWACDNLLGATQKSRECEEIWESEVTPAMFQSESKVLSVMN